MEILDALLNKLNIKHLLSHLAERAGLLVLLFFSFILARWLSHFFFQKYLDQSRFFGRLSSPRQKTLVKLFYNLLDYSLYFLLGYWGLSILGVPVGSLLAGAGIAGVAIGLGAKDFFTDLVNGMFILIERQYDIGEQVKLENLEGTVTKIGIRTTQIRDLDGALHFVPNRYITIVTNQSRGDLRLTLDIPIFASTPLRDIEQVMTASSPVLLQKGLGLAQAPQLVGPAQNKRGQLVYRAHLVLDKTAPKTSYNTCYQHYHDALLDAGIPLPTPDSPFTSPGNS